MLPSLLVASLLPVVSLAVAVPTTNNELDGRGPVKPCTLRTTTELKYRTCPKTSCKVVGQYAKGAKVKVKCVTRGSSVNGEDGWVKNPSGYYVSLAYLTPSLDSCSAQYIC
ncbi:hypothetical protein JDV02_005014 [Purpureocillium takamizusanense]|uniref:Uncharacterized protein n=1 Tax=Purpureocillium takamizusanense TaxID=2060973 RepID=A0A9Q8QGF6_9HYPO|nr:uncharacterized protein JDV02_005014 [Purpureocillium takamizusanense]UNI18761.1 hypothetical protein JDV02_005014 [Purpureocillium takamizusanense]